MGQQSPKNDQPTRATGPGFGILATAEQQAAAEKYPAAMAAALEAGRIFREASDWESWTDSYEKAYRWARLCDSTALHRLMLARLTEASEQMSGRHDVPVRAQALVWSRMGFLHHKFGDYDQAAYCYEKTMPHAEAIADTLLLARLYGSAGIVFWFFGDDYRALHYHEKALQLAATRRDTSLMAAITANMGNAWRSLGSEKAVPAYLHSLSLSPDDPETLMLLSKAYLEVEKHPQKALATAHASLRAANGDSDKADALHQLGRVFFELQQYDAALEKYDAALRYGLKSYGAGHPECAKIHVFRAQALLQQSAFSDALAAYNRAMQALLPLFSPDNADQNPATDEFTTTSLWILEAMLGKARVYDRMYRENRQPAVLERSLGCAESGLAYLQHIKLRYGDDLSKFRINDYAQPACEAALQAAFSLYRHTGDERYTQRAFNLSEQMKSTVLSEALYKKEVRRIAGIPAVALQQERESHEQIAYFEKKMLDGDPALWKDSLFWARRQKDDLERQMADDHPAYREALAAYRTLASPESVQAWLPADAMLVEYFWGDSAMYVFVISRDSFGMQQQPFPAGIGKDLADFRRAAGDWRLSADSSEQTSRIFLEKGAGLYDRLLAPVLAIADKPRLFIVPDGPLHYLPFELLPTRSYAGRWIDRDVPFLLKNKTVSYRFSARPQHTRSMSDGWGGFGMEYDDRTLSLIEPDVSAPESGTLALRNGGKLPFANEEVLTISNMLGGAFWLNEQATRSNFLQNAEKYGVLHLAMHGFTDEQHPLRSRLLFSRSDEAEDPFVYASDLYNMQLTAGLAVLSACQTGNGQWKRGEGVMSLARAFAFAGCPSMVMSLWNVSDKSTADLMVIFYEELRAGKNKDEALRAAKLRYLETVSPEYAKPVYWAGFVPIGEMEALPETCLSGRQWLKPALLALACLLLLLAVLRRQKKGATS